jgi:hypothetical protein
MRLRPLVWGGLLAAMAFSLSRALVTREGVGPIEYIIGVALVACLAVGAVRAALGALAPR